MEKELNNTEIQNIKLEIAPKLNEEQAKRNITKFLEEYKAKFEKYCRELETYRTYFKNNRIENSDGKREKFNQCSKEFNKLLDGFIEEMPHLTESLEIGKLLLEMLTFMQVAQVKNTRVHIRLHNLELEFTEQETKKLLNKSKSLEKKMEAYTKNMKNLSEKNRRLEETLKESSVSVISVMGIFVCIFSLINVNINFFQTLVEKFGSLTNVTALFLIINATALITLTALFRFIYIFFLANRNKTENKRYFLYYSIPIVMFIVGLILLHFGNKNKIEYLNKPEIKSKVFNINLKSNKN